MPINQIPLDQLVRLSPIAIHSYIHLMDLWEVKTQDRWDLLSSTPPFNLEKYEGWNASIALTEEQLIRVDLLLKIARHLQLLSGPELCWKWIQKPNSGPLMKGLTPLQYMINGGLPTITGISNYLEGQKLCHFL